LILDTLEARGKKNKDFRFEKRWFKEYDILGSVASGNKMLGLVTVWAECRKS
jgi:hypothetical protein